MKTNYFLVFVLLIVSGACKRGSLCDRSEKDEYYDIPAATKPYILNKKGEVLVFANSKNDTVEFLCTEESHDYKLVSNSNVGGADCPIIVKKYVESFEYNYIGDTAFFGFMRIYYNKDFYTENSNIRIYVSDSIYDGNFFENSINSESKDDSIIYLGEKIYGSYLYYNKMIYSKTIGLIKFSDRSNIIWQLIQKK